jgi:hypothetical protein
MKNTLAIATAVTMIMAVGNAPAQAGMTGLNLEQSVMSDSLVQKTASDGYNDDDGYDNRRLSRRRFSKREYDRLPIRTTRPDNTGHYTFQDFPHWAARAFQRPDTR